MHIQRLGNPFECEFSCVRGGRRHLNDSCARKQGLIKNHLPRKECKVSHIMRCHHHHITVSVIIIVTPGCAGGGGGGSDGGTQCMYRIQMGLAKNTVHHKTSFYTCTRIYRGMLSLKDTLPWKRKERIKEWQGG